jgi:hypothetical protein
VFVYYLVSIYLASLKGEKWTRLIVWCMLLCPEFSSMPLGITDLYFKYIPIDQNLRYEEASFKCNNQQDFR